MGKSLVSLDVVANDLCSDMGDSTYKHKAKFSRHLLAGYRQLSMFISPSKEVKTVILSYDNQISMPCDFMYVTKVGVRRNGCIAVLSLSNDVGKTRLNDTECCDYLNSVWDSGYAGATYPFYNAWGAGGYYYGELYGMGRTVLNEGTYSVDKVNGIIYIGSNIPTDAEIVIEYVGDGISQGIKYVPMELKECLQYYAKAEFYADRNVTQSQINENKYKKKYNNLKRYYNHQRPIDFAAKVNESFSPTNS
jgi:hypothetical protein